MHVGFSPCKAGTMASGLAPSQGQACITEGPADGEWCSLGTCPFQALFITWVLLFCPPKIYFQACPYTLGRIDAFFPSILYLEKVGSFVVHSPVVLKLVSQLPNCLSSTSLFCFHPLLFFPNICNDMWYISANGCWCSVMYQPCIPLHFSSISHLNF